MNHPTLSLVVRPERDGTLYAQLLEIDIATWARGEKDVLAAVASAITREYKLAHELRRTPFVGIPQAPAHYQSLWREDQASDLGTLDLSPEITEALALYLHAPAPIFTIRELTVTSTAA